ncbi:hypothetical protein AAMO2058_001504300 [Amorphochlora amoebiformis]|mmetsp:Transcript_29159/g.46516  ORF Transcript_29159/g.46516 Transcript_29159/m.46516 type:complete len:490 (-) Transcript_29159:100-1569(-)
MRGFWFASLCVLIHAGVPAQISRISSKIGRRSPLLNSLRRSRVKNPRALDVNANNIDTVPSSDSNVQKIDYPLDVLVVGGGIGGLTLAKTLEMAGANVTVTERTDMDTIKLRSAGGPIQLASNALGVIQRIDSDLFKRVQQMCTITGLRTNGLKDGKTGDWYLMFDTKTPAKKRQLPPTAVIDRPDLQQLLIDDLKGGVSCGKDLIRYENLPNGQVKAYFADGSTHTTDLLVGADGIWSQVRAQMHEEDKKRATYSGFKVYAGICDFVPKDIEEVGYKVYMGKKKYFVATDIGKGRIQWYAFIGVDSSEKTPEGREGISWLHDNVFKEWTEEVRALIKATPVENMESRALYDRPPQVFKSWSDGHVALVGDAIHPMMPNLGQGGCMAIEDAYVLAEELAAVTDKDQIQKALYNYRMRRQVRTAAVQGLSRFGAEMLLRFFDHPTRFELKDGSPQVINFGYNSLLMTAWKVLGVLDTVFKIQFSYLFEEP